jgi:hypothetical protein
MTTLKPRSTKYDIGNARRSFLTTVHSLGERSEISFCNQNSWYDFLNFGFSSMSLPQLPPYLKMDLSPNLKFPLKEDHQITQSYLHPAYPNGHKKLADHHLVPHHLF